MLIHQTLERLLELRLAGMAQAFEEQMRMTDLNGLSFEDRFALLLERELTFRDDRRLARLLQIAKLRLPAAAEDIDFRSPRGLDKNLIMRLAGSQWVRNHENVLISGPTGTGKSYLACALGHSACRQGLSTRFYRFSRLLGDLALARADGSKTRRTRRWSPSSPRSA
jgi:DNA replication protein DnaC